MEEKQKDDRFDDQGLCKHCGKFQMHSQTCPSLSREELINNINSLKAQLARVDSAKTDTYLKFHDQAVMWQGKYRMVKHENNKLRRKVWLVS